MSRLSQSFVPIQKNERKVPEYKKVNRDDLAQKEEAEDAILTFIFLQICLRIREKLVSWIIKISN